MTRYHIAWEIDNSRALEDPKERAERSLMLLGGVKADLGGDLTNWGAFPGTGRGYALFEGNQAQLMTLLEKYVPFVKFDIHPVASVEEVTGVYEALAK